MLPLPFSFAVDVVVSHQAAEIELRAALAESSGREESYLRELMEANQERHMLRQRHELAQKQDHALAKDLDTERGRTQHIAALLAEARRRSRSRVCVCACVGDSWARFFFLCRRGQK